MLQNDINTVKSLPCSLGREFIKGKKKGSPYRRAFFLIRDEYGNKGGYTK